LGIYSAQAHINILCNVQNIGYMRPSVLTGAPIGLATFPLTRHVV
jgi:hypothetical protein